jgi:hypothetical protein
MSANGMKAKQASTPRRPERELAPALRCCGWERTHSEWHELQKKFDFPSRHALMVRGVCGAILEQRAQRNAFSFGPLRRPKKKYATAKAAAATTISSGFISLHA